MKIRNTPNRISRPSVIGLLRGDGPKTSRPGIHRSLADRFWDKVEKTDGCWLWRAALSDAGYGRINGGYPDYKGLWAHRVSYELNVGPIPKGMTLDHLCRNPQCVRPDHLDPCTSWENNLRSPTSLSARRSRATHCGQGHEYTPENTYWDGPQRRHRRCITCRRISGNARYRRNHPEAA